MRVLIVSSSGASARLAAACRAIENYTLLSSPSSEAPLPEQCIALLSSAAEGEAFCRRYPDIFRVQADGASSVPVQGQAFFLRENDAASWRRFWIAIGARGDYLAAWKRWSDGDSGNGKATGVRLSILVPTLSSRRPVSRPLIKSLEGQVSALGDVELLIEEDGGQRPNGAKRNRLLQAARGEYVAFVDDDDWVPGHYVSRLLAATASGADVVTFHQLRLASHPGILPQVAIWDFALARPTCAGLSGMAANHLCAWRRDLARRIAFVPHLKFDDDYFWSMPLLASGLAGREEHIAEVLYVYRQDVRRSACQHRESVAATREWAGRGVECFLRDRQILIACESIDRTAGRRHVPVFNAIGQREAVDRRQLAPFFLCRAH